MNPIWTWITSHPTTDAIIGYWLLSNVASSLPSPTQSSGNGYKFLFTFVNGITGSIPRVFPNLRLPNDPSRNAVSFLTKQ